MTKKIWIALLLIIASIGMAQAQLTVCGLPMGIEKREAKSILQERFGYSSVMEEAGNLKVIDGSAGGINHKFMDFYFNWVNGKLVFNGATFSTPFELTQRNAAIEKRDLIKSIYEQKYTMLELKNSDGFKEYAFGDGNEFIGMISITKGKAKDGKTRLYVEVHYKGPYSETDDI